MYQALIVPVQGDLERVEIDTIKQKQEIIGGLFDVIVTTRTLMQEPVTFDVWVDDEGLIKYLPLNPRASIIAGQTVVGTAVITGTADSQGNTTSVPEDVITFCEAVHNAVVTAQLPPEQQARAVATPSEEH